MRSAGEVSDFSACRHSGDHDLIRRTLGKFLFCPHKPEGGELQQTHRLDVDVSLSVEASSGVFQPDGVDLTQSSRVSQHSRVYSRILLTARNTQRACK